MKTYTLDIQGTGSEYTFKRKLRIAEGITFSQLSLILNMVLETENQGSSDFFFKAPEIKCLFSENVNKKTKQKYNDGETVTFFPAHKETVNRFFKSCSELLYSTDLSSFDITLADNPEDTLDKAPVVLSGTSAKEKFSKKQINKEMSVMFYYHYEEEPCVSTVEELFKKRSFAGISLYDKSYEEIQAETFVPKKGDTDSLKLKDGMPDKDFEDQLRKIEKALDALIKDIGSKSSNLIPLEKILSNHSKEFLLSVAKFLGILNGEKPLKKDLIRIMKDELLKKKRMESVVFSLTPAEIESLNRATCKKSSYHPTEDDCFSTLFKCCYCSDYLDETISISKEFYETYITLSKKKGFSNSQKKKGYLAACLSTGLILYTIMPMHIFKLLLKQNKEVKYSDSNIMGLVNSLPPELRRQYVFEKNTFIASAAYKSKGAILAAQNNIPFYIPTKEEILLYGSKGYDERNLKSFNILKSYLKDICKSEPIAYQYAGEITFMVHSCYNTDTIVSYLKSSGFNFSQKGVDQIEKLIGLIAEEARLTTLRGHTLKEANALCR